MQVAVRVITRGGAGELSDPVVRRTLPTLPGSPPTLLNVTSLQAHSGTISWMPPNKPNGKIDSYQVTEHKLTDILTSNFQVIIEERLNNVWRDLGREEYHPSGTVAKQTLLSTNLKAYTDYRVTIAACNKLTYDKKSSHAACSKEHKAIKKFRTLIGLPGQPNEPKAIFRNSSIVELKWDKQFQVSWLYSL